MVRPQSEIQQNVPPAQLKKNIVTPLVMIGMSAFIIKLLVDVVMYIFMINEKDNLYFDMWYLHVPQVISSMMLIGFYAMFYSKSFSGWFFKVSASVLIVSSVAFIVLLGFDRKLGYVFYFALVATLNFLNSLFIKCNIIPERKIGEIEYIPLIFEIVALFCMAASLYSVFCSFPSLKSVANYVYWDYFNVENALVLNMICEGILSFLFLLSARNGCEYVYDNMYDSAEEFEQ